MPRILSSLTTVLLLTAALTAPASALPADTETWHRLNPFTASGPPEHEQLSCLVTSQWICRYDKQPEPELEFTWDRTIGMFHGREVSVDTWECPEWIATEVCDATVRVVSGNINYANAGGPAFRTSHDLIFTDQIGIAPLYVHWVDAGFACAWYGSLADAIEADPSFEGNCFFAP